MNCMYQVEVLTEVQEDIGSTDIKDLIIYNDDYNTFDHVINTLIRVCKHSQEQAEQCTYIIHYKGKCAVKKGTLRELKPMKEAICEAGITAKLV
jgi:ATP-dependent Clp protease adaptor protein ClpS